jgi:ABC-2 type transport system permease protein
MAPLTGSDGTPTASLRSIPVHAQLLAVAWLRWRIFVNNFRRQRTGKSGVIGLIFIVLLRIIVWGFFGTALIGGAVLCGFLAWKAIADGRSSSLLSLLAGIALFWQFFSINGLSIAATVQSFDPSSLLRFPLRFGRYLVLRTLLGLLSPTTIAGCLALLATAIGIGIADHALIPAALVVLAVYALMNIFLTRMIEVWLERWLAIRRFREIFGAVMALFFVGIQFFNFGSASSSRVSALLAFLRAADPLLSWLPPGFAANSIVLAAGHSLGALVQFSALLAVTALCLAVFAIRMHKQFLGEYLSEGVARSTPPTSSERVRLSGRSVAVTSLASERTRPTISPVITACLRKEWLLFQGNTAQLIGLFTPLIFIVILNRGIFSRNSAFFLPGAIAYVLFAPIAGLYNIFGADGPGVQLYLLAPVRLRDIVIAKNIASVILLLIQVLIAWAVVFVLGTSAIPFPAQISVAFWTVFVIASNLTLGTVRSIHAPRKFIPGQARQTRSTPTNRTSGFLVMGVLFGSVFLQIPVNLLGSYFHQPWLAALVFALLAAAAIIAYALLLRNADRLILTHRDVFSEELCKV